VRRPERAKPDINVTPLVDVVLVLLIIFMVIVPQMEAGASVSLPGVANPDPKVDAKAAPIYVSVTKSGALFLDKVPMTREKLMATLGEVRAVNPGRRVIVKGDKEAKYGLVRAIFHDCQALKFSGVSLQVGDKRKEKK
jgi:biopolymer transport protein ExbD/biopolymer transport protein TolR